MTQGSSSLNIGYVKVILSVEQKQQCALQNICEMITNEALELGKRKFLRMKGISIPTNYV